MAAPLYTDVTRTFVTHTKRLRYAKKQSHRAILLFRSKGPCYRIAPAPNRMRSILLAISARSVLCSLEEASDGGGGFRKS